MPTGLRNLNVDSCPFEECELRRLRARGRRGALPLWLTAAVLVVVLVSIALSLGGVQ